MLRSTSVFLALSLAAGLVPGLALAQQNGPGGPVPANAAVGSLAVNGGRILCTAAINSDGTIATTLAGSFIKAPDGVKVGTYQVGFKGPCGNIQIQNGWFRIVQPDTLTFGTLPRAAAPLPIASMFTTRSGYSASITTVTLSTPRSPCPSRGKPAPSSSTAAVTKQSGAATWSPRGDAS
jgi:hypothetical protein